MYDIVVIGAGVSGLSAARELTRCQASVCVLERNEDVCTGTSKANSGIIHAGYDAIHGSLKAKLNVRGNELMGETAGKLSVPFKRNGSLVVCTNKAELPALQGLYENGRKNGVPGLAIISGEDAKRREPNLSDRVCAALWAPTGGIVCPFELCFALAEQAYVNGAEFVFDAEVTDIRALEHGYQVQAGGRIYESRAVVNAAGVYADAIHNMVAGDGKIKITPRRGEYMLLDKTAGAHVSSTIFTIPGKRGKGVLVTPTVHGNLLVGPTAEDIEDKEGYNTTVKGLGLVREQSFRCVRDLPLEQVITSFAGLRAHEESDDFIIRESKAGFFDCAGIASPGLSSCLAIGEMVAGMIRDRFHLPRRDNWIGERAGILRPDQLTVGERNALILENPAYGNIVCRCEMITEGEVIDAVTRPLGARTMDGVKRRTRAGMGRCQGGFCSPKVMEILSRQCGADMLHVTKSGPGSPMLTGLDKEGL